MTEMPLHVRVAEALGWERCELGWVFATQRWCGTAPERVGGFDGLGRQEIPRFDINWSATGPLIERFGVSVVYSEVKDYPASYMAATKYRPIGGSWEGAPCSSMESRGAGRTPLIAVCNLILAIHQAGKL